MGDASLTSVLFSAGDLHFYMRHSFCPAPPAVDPEAAAAKLREGYPPHPRSAEGGQKGSRNANGHGSMNGMTEEALQSLHSTNNGLHDMLSRTMSTGSVAGMSRTASFASSEDLNHHEVGGNRGAHIATVFDIVSSRAATCELTGWQPAGLPPQQPPGSANLHPYDPEHLVVNGLGGAFLHPTHVFTSARFASNPEPAEDDVFVRGASPPRGRSPKRGSAKGGLPRGLSPGHSSRGVSPTSRKSRDPRRGSFTGKPM